jgi:hypothetical protein
MLSRYIDVALGHGEALSNHRIDKLDGLRIAGPAGRQRIAFGFQSPNRAGLQRTRVVFHIPNMKQ